jgi:glutamine amidotransferase
MCQLFLISSAVPHELNPLLAEFFSHGDENPHGWGLADFSSRQPGESPLPGGAGQAPPPKLVHAHEPAQAGELYRLRHQQPDDSGQAPPPKLVHAHEPAHIGDAAGRLLATPLIATEALAHIRYATVGQAELANCHPFTATDAAGRTWTLAHKGTVFDYSPLSPYLGVQGGTTDSERILLYLVDWMNAAAESKGQALTSAERLEVFTYLVEAMSPGNCLSLIAHDGEQFYVYSNYSGGLRAFVAKGVVVLCTSELAAASCLASAQGEGSSPNNSSQTPSWEPFELCAPRTYSHGRLIARGRLAGERYIDNEADTRYLYQDFAAL